MRSQSLALVVVMVGITTACTGQSPYQRVTSEWTKTTSLHHSYQDVLELAATFKSPEWRTAYAIKDAEARGLSGPAREQRLAQAQADAAGPLEIELLVTTWDRRENDLDRGKKSVWRVRMLDDAGAEIEPLEVIKDKRPMFVLRAEFPALGDFATAYVARFPRPAQPPRALRIRVSSERGGVQLEWPVR
ncbi:MAG: hypothetical protein H6Q90_1472 [Deltaproteobacteria bacterium]|nr:hypothetical protein [Deltaproteobacteria bacterium]